MLYINPSKNKCQQIGMLTMCEPNEKKELGVKLRIVHNKIDKYFDRRHKSGEICYPKGQGMTLHYLIEHDGEEIFQKDIERHFKITAATATNILKGLEKNNLIVRNTMPHDARLKQIILTAKGYETEAYITKNICTLESGMVKGFSEEELGNLMDMLDRVALNIDELIQNLDL